MSPSGIDARLRHEGIDRDVDAYVNSSQLGIEGH